ncbi:alpha-L-rhamnosidase [Talaromyces proteolyticus]|uniref:Alpha-L-rhamnosidase n=1 Tax=Talaromyces proteolyticus TaxID=1131652 RepID=A0AAD4KQI0_9EURO|nr:alpha-L-rhamnosidase [Talaromyces proteolyticus]KAH8696092.1 alpha-L-rhamnosidase [Talaromyces proteolyticus]
MKLCYLKAAVLLLNQGHLVVAAIPSNKTSWQQYVVAPQNRKIVPSSILSQSGNVSNADALVSGNGVTRLSRADVQTTFPSWPSGTTANASSEAAPNTDNGVPRTYYASNAIDGNLTTFWNDNTPAQYPDTLTITSPTQVTLDGVTLESSTDGVPVDFIIETWDGSNWTEAGSITGNNATRCRVPFSQNITTNQVRLTVTQDQAGSKGEYTRVTELWPALVADDSAVPEIVLDFGKNVVGFLQIDFASGSNNAPGIQLAFSETLQYLTSVSDFSRSDNGDTITPGTDQIAVPAAPLNWTDTYGCTYNGNQVCADGIHGFRYLKISLNALSSDAPYTSPSGFVDINSVSLNFTAYLGTLSSYSGWFECSDQQLNEFWYDAAYTNEMVIDTFLADTVDPRNSASPSLLGKQVIFDGAKRDRDPYVGDIAVSGRTAYLTHQDASNAMLNVLADLAEHQSSNGWIPPASINNYTLPLFDYPFWWVTSTWDYILYTGDIAQVTSYYPNLQSVLDTWAPSVTDNTTGLLSKPSSYGDYAFLSRSGIVTYYNTLYVLALSSAANLANALNQSSDASRWQQRADAVSQAINENLWDSASGAYLDDSTVSTRHGQDGNGIAVLSGVANNTRAQSALDYLANKTALAYGNAFMDDDSLVSDGSSRVYAFTSYFDIQARFLTGNADSALDEIRRLYGWMAQSDPGVTFWEGIGANGSAYEGAFTSKAHGWSTGVLPALTNYVLGLMPTGPGYQHFSIAPSFPKDVSWARGQEATRYGVVYVEWSMENGTATVSFTAPNGTVADVTVPKGSEVVLDGTVVWSVDNQTVSGVPVQENADSITVSDVSSGQHTVVSE